MAEMLTGKTLFPGSDRKSTTNIFFVDLLSRKSPIYNPSWQDIDQLTRIMLLVGKPSEALLEKMGSDEVGFGLRRRKSLLQSGFLSRFSLEIITELLVCRVLVLFLPCFFCFRLTKLCFRTDIDQLTKILLLCGTPDPEFLHKITSDEVCDGNCEGNFYTISYLIELHPQCLYFHKYTF